MTDSTPAASPAASRRSSPAMPPLPIDVLLPDIRSALARHTRCILEAPPGAGKTTRVPPALLDADWLNGKKILVLEPRRIAARNAARQMARLFGEEPGRTVGYRVRLESRVSDVTRIEVVTEGVLTRLLQDDPELSGVGCILFDEFHERNLQGDLGLALALDCQEGLREELRLLVMSATLNPGPLQRLLGSDVPVLCSEGRSWPVETRYLPPAPGQRVEEHTAVVIRQALAEHAGSLLVFLPGTGEIRRTAERLDGLGTDTEVRPLYGDLSPREQDAAIAPPPPGIRKVVLATAIAESSLTIEGVSIVIDAGLSRSVRFDPGTGLSRLVTRRVSLAGADQRRGRAGRTGPGVCYRLWHPGEEAGMQPQPRPEILEADMAPLCLELAAWGVASPASLRWLDEPPAEAVRQGTELLHRLDALDRQGRITPLGRAMVRLPLHPRLAHMVIRAARMGLGRPSCLLAALAGERDPLRRDDVDARLRLAALADHREQGALRRLRDSARQIARLAGIPMHAPPIPGSSVPEEDQAGVLLALAYPDRIAQMRAPGSFRLAGGRGAFLPAEDPLAATSLLAVGELGGESGNARIRQAAPLRRELLEELYADAIETVRDVRWNAREEIVVARSRRRFGALVLEERPLDPATEQGVAEAMLEGVRSLGLDALPWTESLIRLRQRTAFMRALDGEEWPDLSDAALLKELENWLGPFLAGITRRSQLRQIALEDAVSLLLPHALRRRLDREAPDTLTVPSGSAVRLNYSEAVSGGMTTGPTLAVKLQELFGMTRTPTVASGRVPVLIHLLSPAGRPLQITRDIEGFWKNGYPAVRAEMRGRYPKHPWPDDPLSAQPTRHTKRQTDRRS